VTLPNVTCDNCTLQLIQVMYDKAGNGFGGKDSAGKGNDDLYYACADIVLKGEAVAGAADAGSSGDIAPPRDPVGGKDAGAADAATGAPKPVVDASTPGKSDAASARTDAGAAEEDDDSDEHGEHEEEETEDDDSSSSSGGGCSAHSDGAQQGSSLLLYGLSLLALATRRRR
jgi:MYXO-CTERM domain-containing protein